MVLAIAGGPDFSPVAADGEENENQTRRSSVAIELHQRSSVGTGAFEHSRLAIGAYQHLSEGTGPYQNPNMATATQLQCCKWRPLVSGERQVLLAALDISNVFLMLLLCCNNVVCVCV